MLETRPVVERDIRQRRYLISFRCRHLAMRRCYPVSVLKTTRVLNDGKRLDTGVERWSYKKGAGYVKKAIRRTIGRRGVGSAVDGFHKWLEWGSQR